jgi:hypothetical protein
MVLLAVFAVKEISHGLTSGLVRFGWSLLVDGVHVTLCERFYRFGFAALGTAIGETGFVGLQLELFLADDADFDGKCHNRAMIRRLAAGNPIVGASTVS